MNDNSVAIAAIGLAGTIATGMIALMAKLVQSINAGTRAHEKVAKAITQGNKEAKERNGHLAELVIQQGDATKILADGAVSSIVQAIQDVPEQHIEHQHVDRVTVDSQVTKKG